MSDSFFLFYFIFKLYIIVLVLPNIKMNPPQVKGLLIMQNSAGESLKEEIWKMPMSFSNVEIGQWPP